MKITEQHINLSDAGLRAVACVAVIATSPIVFCLAIAHDQLTAAAIIVAAWIWAVFQP